MIETPTRSRLLDVAVAHNVRHIGGYPTNRGRVTTDTVVRAASLHRLTPAGIEALAGHGIRTVVDFRSAVERERDVTPDLSTAGLTTIAAAVFETDASPVGQAAEFPGYAAVYRKFLESGRTAYRVLFETIADAPGGVLFHCAAGKDRTGVAAALLLDVAGVHERDIVEDYSHSAALLAPMLDEWLPRMKERGMDTEKAMPLMASNPEDMEATLAYIRETWGSAEGYLLDCGLSPTALGTVRARLVA